MKYERIPYSKDLPFIEVPKPFSSGTLPVPVMSYPISIKENFRRAAYRQNPVWVPNATTDFQNVSTFELGTPPDTGKPFKNPWGSSERMQFTDGFGCKWTFVPEAGGSMLTPGEPPRLSDITKWEEEIVWPDYSNYDFIGAQEKFVEKYKDCDKVLHLNIGQSCTERLVALLGGYTQAMVAMAEEPEAVYDFLMAFANHTKDYFQKMTQIAKVDFVTFHDDWGTEKDTFFSCGMMEEMVFEPTKLIIDAIKATGAVFELHSCGNIGRFVPYMIDLGVDFIQLQRRANDVPALKEKYGDKIGFNLGVEGVELGGTPPPLDVYLANIQKTIELYGKNGGFYTIVEHEDPASAWAVTQEMYLASREYYEANA